ncbi:unnamed protein product [Spodoptera exigua]|nr:unnamed protein product [Spodoptera exigua]
MVIMVFFRAELELLRIDCKDIFGTKSAPVEHGIALKRLKECHRRHVELVKYARLFDSCLSPIMLLYMFVCSVMLCVTAYQITVGKRADGLPDGKQSAPPMDTHNTAECVADLLWIRDLGDLEIGEGFGEWKD